MSDIINIEIENQDPVPTVIVAVEGGSDPDIIIQVEDQEVPPVVYVTVDPNAAQAAIDAAAAAQAILDELATLDVSQKLDKGGYVGTAQTLYDEITAVALPDGITKVGLPVKTGSVISIAALDFEWRSLQVDYTNAADYETTINPATEGFERKDIIVTDNATSSFLKIEGDESDDIALEPATPPNTFKVASADVSGSDVLPLIPVISLEGYRTKLEQGEIIWNTDPYSGYVKVTEKGTFRFGGTLTTLIGMINSSSFLWDGREFTFYNALGINIIVKHDTGIAGRLRFYLPGETDLILHPKSFLKVKYSPETGYLEFMSLSNHALIAGAGINIDGNTISASSDVKHNFFINLNGYIQFTQAPTTWYGRSIGPQNVYWNNSLFGSSFTPSTNFDARSTAITFPFNCKIKNAVVRVSITNGNGRTLNIKGYVYTTVTGITTPSTVREVFSLTWTSVGCPKVLLEGTDFTINNSISILKNESFQIVVNQSSDLTGIATNMDMVFEFEKE